MIYIVIIIIVIIMCIYDYIKLYDLYVKLLLT